jgi:hypothetical protein
MDKMKLLKDTISAFIQERDGSDKYLSSKQKDEWTPEDNGKCGYKNKLNRAIKALEGISDNFYKG